MTRAGGVSSALIETLRQDATAFSRLTQDQMFALDFELVQSLQLEHLQRRFRELRPKVRILDRLAREVGIDAIEGWDDLAPLALPHTMYKSYLAADVEKGRFDRLTHWLGTLTAHDLAGVDTCGCASLDDWMQRIEAATPLRPVTSSGTSGKISIFPRDVDDEIPWRNAIANFLSPYGGEPGVDFRSGTVPVLCPWPFDKGRQSVPTLLRIVRAHLFGGREDMVTTQRADTIRVEEQWLAGKVRRAELAGEKPQLTEREQRVLQDLAARRQAATGLMAGFARRVVTEHRGKPIAFLAGWPQIFEFVCACEELGIRPEWTPGSVFFVGGGNKGLVLPDGWRARVDTVLPPDRYVFKEMYGMTETTSIAPRCREGFYHPFPWGVHQVVDPDTSRPLPRIGTQTGRMMIHDLVPRAFWAGMLSGDEVTIHWDGGCGCGRKGPYFAPTIQRFSEARGGDDKITCTKSPDAYAKLERFATELL